MKGFSGDTPYSIMFGPDICGSSTRKVHVIINYKGENHELKSPITAETDQLSHVYTLVIRKDASYEVPPSSTPPALSSYCHLSNSALPHKQPI